MTLLGHHGDNVIIIIIPSGPLITFLNYCDGGDTSRVGILKSLLGPLPTDRLSVSNIGGFVPPGAVRGREVQRSLSRTLRTRLGGGSPGDAAGTRLQFVGPRILNTEHCTAITKGTKHSCVFVYANILQMCVSGTTRPACMFI